MASTVDGRAVEIRQGNINNDHIPVGPVRDLFPSDAFGGRNKSEVGLPVLITLAHGETVETDIAADKGILRIRGSVVRDFYKAVGAKDGTRLFVERLGARSYRISAIG